MHTHDVIVIGTSAGGVEALMQLVRGLPADIPAAIFIVLHIARRGTSLLPQILLKEGNLPAFFPKSGQAIEHGRIYIAPNDQHLLVKQGCVLLNNGPRENGFRPGIDPLFRTAAHAYGKRVVGVVLTGLLDNGSAGLVSVKEHGGIAIVQDPTDAMFPAMPENALKVVEADYVLPLADMAETLVTLARTPIAHNAEPRALANSGNDSAETGNNESIHYHDEGKISELVCPECGGVLVEFRGGKEDKLVNFRCRVGHRYSLHSMMVYQSETTEAALWAAVRALEESSTVSRRMAQHFREWDDLASIQAFEAKAFESEQHAENIRQILLGQKSYDINNQFE